MKLAIDILIGIIAAQHLYFFYFEAFAWTTSGRRIFKKFPKEFFHQTKGLAANQGLYNAFLAAGLLWTYGIEDSAWSMNVAIFFLGCVSVAGIFGAFTADRKIFFIQGIPALIALLLVFLAS